MTLGDFRVAIRNWIAVVSGQPTAAIWWQDEGRPIGNPLIGLSVISAESQASDLDQTVDASDNETTIAQEIVDARIQVSVESISQTDLVGAAQLASRIRFAFQREASRATLRDLGIVTVGDTADPVRLANYEASGQKIHVQTFELWFRVSFDETTVEIAEYFDRIRFSVTEHQHNVRIIGTEVTQNG